MGFRLAVRACNARQQMIIGPSCESDQGSLNRPEKHMGTLVIEVTEFKSEVTFDLRGHLEATMASEAT